MNMYHWKLIDKLIPRLRLPALVQNYSKKVEPGELDPAVETPYYSIKNRRINPIISVNTIALLHRNTLTWKEVKVTYKWRQEDKMRKDQRYLPERQKILGPDLSATHFITSYHGKVKFKHLDAWMTYENILKNEVPSSYVPDFCLEAIDASETDLCYEGFDNFRYLKHLKTLMLRNCRYIDDWCLHRLSMCEGTLEHLDISGCHNISERGLCTLHVLKNLKTLILHDTPKIANKELTCLLLQDILPKLNIVGVNYEDPALWDRLKEHLT